MAVARHRRNITEQKESIGKLLPPDTTSEKELVGDLVQPGMWPVGGPIDPAAPKGGSYCRRCSARELLRTTTRWA
jgi:hypothetical protein